MTGALQIEHCKNLLSNSLMESVIESSFARFPFISDFHARREQKEKRGEREDQTEGEDRREDRTRRKKRKRRESRENRKRTEKKSRPYLSNRFHRKVFLLLLLHYSQWYSILCVKEYTITHSNRSLVVRQFPLSQTRISVLSPISPALPSIYSN